MTLARIFCFCALIGLAQAQSAEELRMKLRESLAKLQEADQKMGDYSYTRYNVRREFHSNGSLKAERTVLALREFEDGIGFIHQVQRDGKPVPDAEIKQSQDAARARAAQLRAMSPAERAKAEPESRSRAQEQSFLKEFPDALEYKKIGEETIDGRRTWVLECWPRPGYKAANLRARVFEKVRGKVWLDAAALEIVRVDAEVYETVNIGWGMIGKVQKGTRFHLERRRLADGSWLPESQRIRFAARILLFKSLAQEEITRDSDYRHKSDLAARAK
jgi:hypothetical protein